MSERVELPTVEERCGTCRFWKKTTIDDGEYADAGACRRYPPVFFVADRGDDAELEHLTMATRFPWPSSHDWCGEWQAKRPTPPALPRTPASGPV